MLKTSFSIFIIIVVVLGLTVLIKELFQHFVKTKPMAKESVQYKLLLFVIGLDILVEKTIAVIDALS